ncbi:MAG: hypothetical protein ACPGQV_16415 [Alphaproteobacteria bacterium]
MPTAMSAIALKAQQHVEPSTRQVVAEEAVFEIDLKVRLALVGNAPPFDGLRIETV